MAVFGWNIFGYNFIMLFIMFVSLLVGLWAWIGDRIYTRTRLARIRLVENVSGDDEEKT